MPQGVGAPSTRVGREGERKVLESGAWAIPMGGQREEVQNENIQEEATHGGWSRAGLRAQGRVTRYSLQQSRSDTESLLSYHWLKISFPRYTFQAHLLRTSFICNIFLGDEFLATVL